MPIHLRGERCALRGAFLRWILFSAALPVIPFFIVLVLVLARLMGWEPSHPELVGVFHIMLGPETMGMVILELDVPAFRGLPNELKIVLALAVFAARSCAVFGYGAFLLSRGKRAPYAETLWLLVACASVAVWKGFDLAHFDAESVFYAFAAALALTGLLIFVCQRRQPPAWKWKNGDAP